MRKSILKMSVASAALLLSVPALAQTGPATNQPAADPLETDPGDIVVTAQKRNERLQSIPLAVTVVSGDALNNIGKVSLEGAAYLVPSLNFLKSGTTLNQALFLRGVGTATFSIAGEPSVSTVVDGVVFSRAGEAFGDLVDIDRLEVLRGPQGTLFGKNASAGVVNIISKKPTADFGGYAEIGWYSDQEYRGRAALNVPLGKDVRSRLTGFYSNFAGNIRNVTVNQTVNGWEHYGGRLQLEADVTSDLKLSFSADYRYNNDNCCADIIATPPINGATGLVTTNASTAVLPTPLGDRTRQVAQNLVTRTIEEGYGFSLQADLAIGTHTLTSITAWRGYKNTEIRDGDWLPAAAIGFNQLHDFGPQTGDTFTQEVRLTSPGGKLFDYVLGGFYSRADSTRIFARDVQRCSALAAPAPTVFTPCTSPLAGPSNFPSGTATFGSVFENFALFGQGTANIASWFRFIGGFRFTSDSLSVFHSRVSRNLDLAAGVPVGTGGINPNFDQGVFNSAGVNGTPLASNGVPYRASTSATDLSGKAGFQVDITPNNITYGTYTRGFKGPAYNVFFNLSKSGTNVIAPETSNAYEIGLKNTFLDGRLTLNIALFLAQYENFQANNPDLVADVVVTRFTNAGRVSTRGVEVESVLRPINDLTIAGGFAYTDARVDQFNAAPGAAVTAIIPAGTPLAFAPKWKGNLSIDYRIRTGGSVDVFLGAQGSYQSSQLSLFAPDAIQRRLGTIPAYGLVNLTAGIQDKNDRFRLTFLVRNLFDQSFAAAIINGGPGGAYRYQIPRDADRYFGIIGRYNF